MSRMAMLRRSSRGPSDTGFKSRVGKENCLVHRLFRETDHPDSGVDAGAQDGASAPCSGTYTPSVIVVAQGSKRVDLGKTNFIYDQSRFLLTSIDLPIVSQVVEASEAKPLLAMAIKLEMPVVRELLSREEVRVRELSSDSPAMVTGEITAELLSACCRLLDLLANPQDIPYLSGLIQREIIYRLLCGPEGARLRAIATSGDQSHRTARAISWIKDNYAKTGTRG